MWMPVRILVFILTMAILCACLGGEGEQQPKVNIETVRLSTGESHVIDPSGSRHTPSILVNEPGRLFVHSVLFAESPDLTDVAGVRQVFLFVPERLVMASKEAPTQIRKAEGLRAFEYSRNDASPENYCFQELSEGAVSIRMDAAGVMIEGELNTPPVAEPSDARCDTSSFAVAEKFPL